MGAVGDIARDFVEMKLHHVGVGMRKRQSRSDAAGRTDRAEQIGVVIALIGGLCWPRSTPCPLADEAVLLAIRASSWNQISTGVVSGSPSRWAFSARGKFF